MLYDSNSESFLSYDGIPSILYCFYCLSFVSMEAQFKIPHKMNRFASV